MQFQLISEAVIYSDARYMVKSPMDESHKSS